MTNGTFVPTGGTKLKEITDAQFVELLTSGQVRLRSYALSLVFASADADDIVQAASLAMWEKRQTYDPERSFLSWGSGFVLKEVLRHRRKVATDKLMFGEALISMLATDYLNHVDEIDLRREQLNRCVEKLGDEDRELLSERYTSGTNAKQIAQQRGVPPTTIYSALTRIRETLYTCVESHIAKASHPKL